MGNPLEVNYQVGQTLYYFRSSQNATGTTAQFYNAATKLYENFNAANWLQYKLDLTESAPGYYRAVVPAESLVVPATELVYEQQGVTASTADAPAIAQGNSQGVNINTWNGIQQTLGSNITADVNICNLALTHLGQKQITTLSDNSENARRCNLIFNNCRDEVLRAASWKFASVIEPLVDISASTTVPVGWTYVYQYPSECILIRKVFVDNAGTFDFPYYTTWPPTAFVFPHTNPEGVEFKVAYQKDLGTLGILCNLGPAYIEYTARMTDATFYDAAFIKTLSYKLAADLSNPLTGSNQTQQEMIRLYQFALSEAARLNAVEDNILMRNKSQYMDCR